jgi:nuclear pore complex protein Nup93
LFNKPAQATPPALGLSLGGTSTAQSKPAFPSLFSTSTSQPQQSTTANPLGLGQTTTTGQPSLFNTSSAPQPPQPPQQQGAGLGQSTNAGNGTGRSAHFDHLLERGKKRNAGENGIASFDELPSLQLGLGDIARKVRNLGAGGPSADQGQDRVA